MFVLLLNTGQASEHPTLTDCKRGLDDAPPDAARGVVLDSWGEPVTTFTRNTRGYGPRWIVATTSSSQVVPISVVEWSRFRDCFFELAKRARDCYVAAQSDTVYRDAHYQRLLDTLAELSTADSGWGDPQVVAFVSALQAFIAQLCSTELHAVSVADRTRLSELILLGLDRFSNWGTWWATGEAIQSELSSAAPQLRLRH